MALVKTRAKQGYLSYDNMLAKIASGDLDAYDVVYVEQQKQCYIVSPSLEPWAIKSRVYTFESVEDAVEKLNTNTDTYNGQIISVLVNNKYTAYIVNTNEENKFFVEPLNKFDDIDYDTIGNRPIINLTGSFAKPVVLDQQSSGIYLVKNQYKISNKLATVFSSAYPTLFWIENNTDTIYIREINAKNIKTYVSESSSDKITESEVVTTEYLKENNYVTSNDVDKKIAVLDVFTKKEAEDYITEYLQDNPVLQSTIESTVEKKINEKVSETSADDIENLFS